MATVRIPSSLHAQITRRAISPRLAINTLLKSLSIRSYHEAQRPLCAAYGEQRLSVFHGLAIADEALHDFSGEIAFDLVHQLHGFNDAKNLAYGDRVADFRERGGPRRRRFVERAHDRRADDMQSGFLRFGGGGGWWRRRCCRYGRRRCNCRCRSWR